MRMRFAAIAFATLFASGALAQSSAPIAERLTGDLQVRLGLTPAQAAGMVGNLATETGNFQHMQELNPTVEGSRGGYGYAQWTGPRRRQYESYAASRGVALDAYETNLDFLVYEMETTERRAYERLLATNTVDEAALSVMNDFLRPGIPHADSRLGYAREFAEGNFTGSGVAGPGTQFGSGFAGYEPPASPIDTYTPEALMPWISVQMMGAVPVGRAY